MEVNQLTYSDQIRSISERVEIVSTNEVLMDHQKYVFYNQQSIAHSLTEFKNFGANCEIEKSHYKHNFMQFISTLLYSRFYCNLNEDQKSTMLPSKQERDRFMQQLSEANRTTCGYDYFWKIISVNSSGSIYLTKNGEFRQQQLNTFVYADNVQNQPIVNSYVHIIRQKEQLDSQPVFYYVFSNELQSQQIELARIYFNLMPEGASKLVAEITTVFNSYKIPFSFKCLNHPDLYNRNDSAVLYLDKLHVDVSLFLLKSIVQSIYPFLKESIPWFTKQIYKGIAYAEDPGKGESFGMNRCFLVANALNNAYENNVTSQDEKFNFIIQNLQSNGLRNDHPYLNNHTSKIPMFNQFQ